MGLKLPVMYGRMYGASYILYGAAHTCMVRAVPVPVLLVDLSIGIPSTVCRVLKGRCCIVQPTSFAVGMHRRADRYRSIAIVKGYRTVKILWPTDECRKSSRLYKWEYMAIFSHFWRNLLAYSRDPYYCSTV